MSSPEQSREWIRLQERLTQAIKALDDIERTFQNVPALFEGNAFAEQASCAVRMENLFTAATHETATGLRYLKQEMEDLANFIAFRKRHGQFSSDALMEIIDAPLSTKDKQRLWHDNSQASFPVFTQSLEQLKREWRSLFGNRSYQSANTLGNHV
ncbi:hypothetical protein SOASR030_20470 [Leminorella grimontii]|uniref:Uncharacterized protein n=1 Tax=Leminorella grimontii TaxID=82981 RepID=A0AAV5N1E2_9GAMM|nr:hypothetical protein [Leminorella grimontii]GKX55935.1 hypothetical protein SOASR030_20470 [Leminorella grimontii]VFS57497.1 Uncharacterised protein [Leminorella grimontii]